MSAIRLNGIDLGRWTVVKGTFYRPPISVRRYSVEAPGEHGTRALGLPTFDEPQVTLELAPGDVSDDESLEALTANLTALLASPSLTISRTVAGRVEEAPAVLVSVAPAEDFVWGRWARYTAVLAIPGVFLRDAEATTFGPYFPGTHTLTGLDCSGPVSDAVVRFTGPASQVSVRDAETLTGVSWAGSLPSGQYLYLDPNTMSAWQSANSSAWAGGGINVSGGLDYPGAGRLQLWPISKEVDAGQTRVNAATNPRMKNAAGVVTLATNHATNPRMVRTMGSPVVVATNPMPGIGGTWATLPPLFGAGFAKTTFDGHNVLRVTAPNDADGGEQQATIYRSVASHLAEFQTFVIYAKSYQPASNTGTQGTRIRLGGNWLPTNQSDSAPYINIKGEWVQHVLEVTPPAWDESRTALLNLQGNTNPGDVTYWRDFAVLPKGVPYFDGGTPNDDTFTYSWVGTPYESESRKTALRIGSELGAPSSYLQAYRRVADGKYWASPDPNGPATGIRFDASSTSDNGPYAVTFLLRAFTPADVGKTVRLAIYSQGTSQYLAGPTNVTLEAEPKRVTMQGEKTIAGGTVTLLAWGAPGGSQTNEYGISDLLITKGPVPKPYPYFDGSTLGDGTFTFAWGGAVDSSISNMQGVVVSGNVSASTGGRMVKHNGHGLFYKMQEALSYMTVGGVTSFSADITNVTNETMVLRYYTAASGGRYGEGYKTLLAGETARVSLPRQTTSGTLVIGVARGVDSGLWSLLTGPVFAVDKILINGTTSTYFDGDMTSTHPNRQIRWTGTPHDSISVEVERVIERSPSVIITGAQAVIHAKGAWL